MSCPCFGPRHFHYSYYQCASDMEAVGTFFNFFSYDAVSDQDLNLSPSLWWSDALCAEPWLKVIFFINKEWLPESGSLLHPILFAKNVSRLTKFRYNNNSHNSFEVKNLKLTFPHTTSAWFSLGWALTIGSPKKK